MKIKHLTADDKGAWDDYVSGHPAATVYHRSAWKSVIEDSMGYPGSYIMAYENNKIVGVYPLFILSTGLFGTMGVSLPFVNYGGILSDSLEVEKLLLNEAESVGLEAGCRYIELRQRYPLNYKLPASTHKVSSVISLQGGADEVFKRLHQNVRNKIRKSRKNGVVIQRGIEYISDFYDVYARNLRDLGTPVLARQFFDHVADKVGDRITVYRAARQGKTIGAKIILIDNKTCYFEWSASLRESLRYAPVHAMNWAAIEDACAAGCEQIDLGRSTAESTHYNFKKYWGVETQTLPWGYQLLNCKDVPGLNKENPKVALLMAAWKKIPLQLSKMIGPPLARRLP